MKNPENAARWRQKRQEALEARRAAIPEPIAASLPAALDVASIRASLPNRGPGPVTQDVFARRFGFSAASVRDWEQGRRKPKGASRLLLLLLAHDAAGIEAAIKAAVAVGSAAKPK